MKKIVGTSSYIYNSGKLSSISKSNPQHIHTKKQQKTVSDDDTLDVEMRSLMFVTDMKRAYDKQKDQLKEQQEM